MPRVRAEFVARITEGVPVPAPPSYVAPRARTKLVAHATTGVPVVAPPLFLLSPARAELVTRATTGEPALAPPSWHALQAQCDSVVGEFDALVEEDFMDDRIYGAVDHDELLCLDEDCENLGGKGGGLGIDSSNEENHRFLAIDPKEVQNVENDGRRRSKHLETWTRKAFDAWRCYKKYDTSRSIEDLSEIDVKNLVNLLHDFMLQVAKKKWGVISSTKVQYIPAPSIHLLY